MSCGGFLGLLSVPAVVHSASRCLLPVQTQHLWLWLLVLVLEAVRLQLDCSAALDSSDGGGEVWGWPLPSRVSPALIVARALRAGCHAGCLFVGVSLFLLFAGLRLDWFLGVACTADLEADSLFLPFLEVQPASGTRCPLDVLACQHRVVAAWHQLSAPVFLSVELGQVVCDIGPQPHVNACSFGRHHAYSMIPY